MALALLALTLTEALAETPAPVGYVGDCAGHWLQNGARIEPHTAPPILPGSVITLDSADTARPVGATFIVIYLFDGRRIERTSEKPETLHEAIRIDPTVKEDGAVSQFLSAAARLFRRSPQRYAITMSRGSLSSRLQEAVLKLEEGRVDLAPALRDTAAGQYKARLQRLEADAVKPDGPVLQQEIDWDPRHAAEFKADGLRPGIWQVSLVSSNNGTPLDGSARVLLCTPDVSARSTAAFSQAANLCNSWKEAKPAERRSFLRKILDSLDASK